MSEPPVPDPQHPLSQSAGAGLPAWLAYWPALMVGLAALALSGVLLLARQAQDSAHAQNQLHQDLSAIRTRLEAVAQATFSPTLGLEAMIQLDAGISSARFEALAGRVAKLLPQVRSIVAAPDDVARYVYPLDGNQAVLNLDYRKIPVQYQQVQQARRLGRPLLVGPVQLVQGGQGIIQRTPVFLPEAKRLASGPNVAPLASLPADDSKPGYWGVISVVADLARFIDATGLDDHPNLRLALHQVQGEPQARGELIWGDASLSQEAASVTQYVQMPGAVWALTAAPTISSGAAAGAHRYIAEIAASLLSSSALALLAALLVYRRRLLQAQNLALSNEVQQRAQSQNELQAAQTRFRSLAEISADWVWEQDQHLRFSFISRLADEHGEHDPQRLLGRYRWDSPNLSADIDWDSHRAVLARHEAFRDFEYSHLDDAGQLRYVSISGTPVFDTQGVFQGYRGTGRDISAARRAEAALRKSEQDLTLARDHLQAVLDAALEFSIIATDLQGHIGLFNRGAEQMLGYTEAEVLGRTPALIHLPSEVEARAAELSLSHGRPISGFEAFVLQARECGIETRVWTYVRKDGSHLEVSLTVSCMQDSTGQAIGFLGIARDISAQRSAERELVSLNASLESRVEQRTAELSRTMETLKQAQMELLRAEKMAALGSLVAGIAHELNTPLGNCLTTASTLLDLTQQTRRNFEGGQMRRSVLETYLNDADTACNILLRSMSTANELVAHFKQVSVDQATAQRRQFSLVSVLDDVLSLLRPRLRKAGIALEINAALPRELDSFPGPLGQVLTNLIMNAILHAFDGKSVEPLLTMRVEDLPGSPDGGEVTEFLLIVEDNGVGMSSEVKRRAFDPFFTTKMGQGGTGLGLNIVYNIVTGILGGQIALNSEAQQGSRFTIRLPFVAPQLGSGADKLS